LGDEKIKILGKIEKLKRDSQEKEIEFIYAIIR